MVDPQNSELLVGVDRFSVALFDQSMHPIVGARATVEVQKSSRDLSHSTGPTIETRPLQDVGAEYGGIPIYVGTVRLPDVGLYNFLIHATLKNGTSVTGHAFSTVGNKSKELPVGYQVPSLKQPILGDPGVTIGQIDSGVPPDTWHTATIADGLAQHKPMVLYFGEPGFCKSRTCGPTVHVLQQLANDYGSRFLFEHIEDHFPAGPAETSKGNPVFDAFGLQTDPWIFFVNAAGIVSDRFEGPVTVEQLRTAADGTLVGHVPAVDISLAG